MIKSRWLDQNWKRESKIIIHRVELAREQSRSQVRRGIDPSFTIWSEDKWNHPSSTDKNSYSISPPPLPSPPAQTVEMCPNAVFAWGFSYLAGPRGLIEINGEANWKFNGEEAALLFRARDRQTDGLASWDRVNPPGSTRLHCSRWPAFTYRRCSRTMPTSSTRRRA